MACCCGCKVLFVHGSIVFAWVFSHGMFLSDSTNNICVKVTVLVIQNIITKLSLRSVSPLFQCLNWRLHWYELWSHVKKKKQSAFCCNIFVSKCVKLHKNGTNNAMQQMKSKHVSNSALLQILHDMHEMASVNWLSVLVWGIMGTECDNKSKLQHHHLAQIFKLKGTSP